MDSVGKKVEMNNLLAVLMNEHGVSQSQIDSMIRVALTASGWKPN